MKILMSIHHTLDENAGAPGATISLAAAMTRQGAVVELFSLDKFKLNDDARGQLQYPFSLKRYLSHNSKNFDIIDASTGDTWVWLLGRRHFGPKIVTRSHGLEHVVHQAMLDEARLGTINLGWKYRIYHGGIRLWQVALTLRKSDLSLFLNDHDLTYAVKTLGLPKVKVAKVVNGLPNSFLNLPCSSIDTEFLRIANIASFNARKGIYYGCPALNNILLGHKNVLVSFIGTGVLREEVLKHFDHEVHPRITVIPKYNHESLPYILRGHRIMFFPTLAEGFSLALLESMAMGLAPVTTNTFGPLEIVRNEQNGLLVGPRDADALQSAVERLLSHPRLLEELQKNAYYTAQKFGWDGIAKNTLSLYRGILEKPEARI